MLFSFIPMTKGEERHIKRQIRKLIILQQEVLLAGGVSTDSTKLAFMQNHQWQILGTFGLPMSRKNLNLLTRYPYSMAAIRQPDMVPERLANLYHCKWFNAWFLDGDLAMGYGNDDVSFGNLSKKADYLFWKLTQEAEKYQEE
jgi:hypothetical protein